MAMEKYKILRRLKMIEDERTILEAKLLIVNVMAANTQLELVDVINKEIERGCFNDDTEQGINKRGGKEPD